MCRSVVTLALHYKKYPSTWRFTLVTDKRKCVTINSPWRSKKNVMYSASYIWSVIGSPDGAVQSVIWHHVMHSLCVWFYVPNEIDVPDRAFEAPGAGSQRTQKSGFPCEPGWYGATHGPGSMCHTLKTHIHACNQTRCHLILSQQQRQPNTTECTI